MTFNQFVEALFNTPISGFNEDFKEKLKQINNKQLSEFWNSLLSFMEQKADQTHFSLLQTDFGENSFFDYIQSRSDVNATTDDMADYWNESIQDLVDYFNTYFNDETIEETIIYPDDMGMEIINGKIPLANGNSFNSRDIKNADAALAFGALNETVITQLVRPWYNVDWKSYYKVRKTSNTGRSDIDQKAASNDKNLTFTRTQQSGEYENNLNRWLRLIMPNNSRRVSVEDLNRNFWVISSTLQAISAYLFDPTAPIPTLMKGAIKELAQLWDNIMYLWAAFGIISQKEASDMRVIILPLSPSEYITYQKYDGFTNSNFPVSAADQAEYIIPRVKYLVQRYSHSNLCILPYTRQTNYYRNHFESLTFRGAVFHNRKTNKTTYVPFKATVGEVSDASVYFRPKDMEKYLYAIRETDTYYRWTFPVKNIGNVIDDTDFKSKRFYGAYRIIPSITFQVNKDGNLEISNLTLTAIDAVAKSLFNTDNEVVRYSAAAPITEADTVGNFVGEVLMTGEPELGNLSVYDATLQEALYLGEIPSCSGLTASHPIFVYNSGKKIVGNGELIKIGNYLPKTFKDYYTNSDYCGFQVVPDGSRQTDYLLNFTITGLKHKTVVQNNIFGGTLGSGNIISGNNCYYYYPVIHHRNSYSLTHDRETPDMLSENDYKSRGTQIISDYITKDTAPDVITYYIAGVGIQPWHNTTDHTGGSDPFQGYWASTVLTHMYRYIPIGLEEYVPAGDTILYKNGVKIGSLECLGKINKLEKAFTINGEATFTEHANTTWRLPQLIPETNLGSYVVYDELLTKETYFINPNDAHFSPIYANGGISAITKELNTNYQDYMEGGQYADELKDESDVAGWLSSPSGTWDVFDGYTNAGNSDNKHKYRKQRDRREVAYTDFYFDNKVFKFKKDSNNNYIAKGRKIGGSFNNITPSDNILPTSPYSDMIFSW